MCAFLGKSKWVSVCLWTIKTQQIALNYKSPELFSLCRSQPKKYHLLKAGEDVSARFCSITYLVLF